MPSDAGAALRQRLSAANSIPQLKHWQIHCYYQRANNDSRHQQHDRFQQRCQVIRLLMRLPAVIVRQIVQHGIKRARRFPGSDQLSAQGGEDALFFHRLPDGAPRSDGYAHLLNDSAPPRAAQGFLDAFQPL